jgi:hypothetical protein
MGVRDILSQIKHQGRGWSGQCEYSYRGSLQELFHEAASALADRRIPFFLVDEADRADAGRRFVVLNVLRDLVDESGACCALLGTDVIRHRLAVPGPYLSQVSSRVVQTVEFTRPSLGDVRKIAESHNVKLADEMLKFLIMEVRGSLRLVVDRLRMIEAVAREAGLQEKVLDFATCRRLGVIAIPASSDAADADGDSQMRDVGGAVNERKRAATA